MSDQREGHKPGCMHPDCPGDPKCFTLKGGLDLPYEDTGEPVYPGITAGDTEMSSAVVILAAWLDMEDGSKLPVVIYRFSKGDGTFYPDRTLILEPQQLNQLPTLTSQAVAGAFRGARR